MATAASLDVDREGELVHIHDLTIHDAELVAFLEEFDDDRVEGVVTECLKVGAKTLQLAETAKEMEYVKREFEGMQTVVEGELEDLQDELEHKFGEDGRVPRVLDEYLGDDGSLQSQIEVAFADDGIFANRLDAELGENGERIQAALDPDKEGTPTYRLKQALRDDINDIREQLFVEEGAENVRQRTTLSGYDFEDAIEELLTDLVYQTPHTFAFTGDDEGELGRNVGDFVISLGDTEQTIVVEAKSDSGYTQPKIKEEMEAAIVNRDADYGVFVAECEAYIPSKIGYLQEFDRRYLVVATSQDEDDDLDPRLFRIGFNWAKMRAVERALDAGEDVDAEVIQSKVEEISDSIEQFGSIKSKCNTIRKLANGIEESLNDIAEEVNTHLNQLRAELSKAET